MPKKKNVPLIKKQNNWLEQTRTNRGRYYWNDEDDLHRLDGPAVEYKDGTVEYWVHGCPLDEKTYKSRCVNGIYEAVPEVETNKLVKVYTETVVRRYVMVDGRKVYLD